MFVADVVVRSNDELIDALIDEGVVRWVEDGHFITSFDLYEGRRHWVVELEDPLDPYPEENTGIYVPKTVPKQLVPTVALYALLVADKEYWDLYSDTQEFEEKAKEIETAAKQILPTINGRIVGVEKAENAVTVRVWW